MDFNTTLLRFGLDISGRRFSNAIAENNNSHIQRVIDIAYGYQNFMRFRARIMLLLSYKNQR